MVRARERDISAIVPSESPLIQRCHGEWFLLFQHGVQLVSQVIEHAADVIEDANCGLLLSHRAKHTHTHTESQHYNGTAYVLVERLAVKCANPAVQILYLFTVVVPLEMSVLAQHIMWQWWQIHIKILCNY